MTFVRVLTPPGSGAIAVVEVAGDGAWGVVKSLFKPAGGKTLPESPVLRQTWFGRLGEGVGDEVVVAVTNLEPDPTIEVHCHGGRTVVRWLVSQFLTKGCAEEDVPTDGRPWALLERATTLRTANILLDQCHGAYDRAIEQGDFARLAALAPVGRHLVEPWQVVIAGPPNVGKSSLVNALAGYQRSIVSPVAGTTRDVVTTRIAFDGWPVELSDTAGLRDGESELESAGIERARQRLAAADVVVWVYDGTASGLVQPDYRADVTVVNKVDAAAGWDWAAVPGAIRVSAVTGQGIPELIAAVVAKMVPVVPEAGEGVPYTPELAEEVVRKINRDEPQGVALG
jgi:tRNA modification GTPase